MSCLWSTGDRQILFFLSSLSLGMRLNKLFRLSLICSSRNVFTSTHLWKMSNFYQLYPYHASKLSSNFHVFTLFDTVMNNETEKPKVFLYLCQFSINSYLAIDTLSFAHSFETLLFTISFVLLSFDYGLPSPKYRQTSIGSMTWTEAVLAWLHRWLTNTIKLFYLKLVSWLTVAKVLAIYNDI